MSTEPNSMTAQASQAPVVASPKPRRFRLPGCPTWKALSHVNGVYFLRVSYLVLVGVPVIAAVQHELLSKWIRSIPLTFRLAFFSALCLSLAHMVFQAFAPQLVRRFESPNDLYRDMLQIKSLQMQYLPNDLDYSFDIKHCREGFEAANRRAPLARGLCGLLYGVGILLAFWLLAERSLIVLNAAAAP